MKCPNCSFDNPNNLGICKVCGETIHDAAPESLRDTVSLDFALQERFRKRAERAREQRANVEPDEPVERHGAVYPGAHGAYEPPVDAPRAAAQESKPEGRFEPLYPHGEQRSHGEPQRRPESSARRQTEIRLKPDLYAQAQPQLRRSDRSPSSEYRPGPSESHAPAEPPSAGWQPLPKNEAYYSVPLSAPGNQSSRSSHIRPQQDAPQSGTEPAGRAEPQTASPRVAEQRPAPREVRTNDAQRAVDTQPMTIPSRSRRSQETPADADGYSNLARELQAMDGRTPRESGGGSKKGWLATFIILLLVVILAGLVYLIYTMSQSGTPGTETTTQPTTEPTTVAVTTSTTASTTQPTTRTSETTASTTSSEAATNSSAEDTTASATATTTGEMPLSNFSASASSSGGSPASDLTIDSMRIGVHEDFTRVVIDLDPAQTVPTYNARIAEDGRTVTLTIQGVVASKAPDLTGDGDRIESVSLTQTSPDTVTCVILLTRRVQYRVFGLESPGRIVIDLANL